MLSRFWEKTWTDPAIFWVAATAIITAVAVIITGCLAWLAWRQLRDLAQTSRADFIFRLKNDFFTETARGLFFLIDENLLQFEDVQIPFFTIKNEHDPSVKARLTELGIKYSTVSTYLIDDALLGPLEDVNLFLTEKLITEKHASEMFETYVLACGENAEIQQYLAYIRRIAPTPGIYDGFDALFKKFKRSATRN